MSTHHKLLFLAVFFIASLTLQAQDKRSNIDYLNFGDSDTLKIIDTEFYMEEDADTDFETPDETTNSSMLFIYFDWMPGTGKYNNFDILSTHYKHETSTLPDTLILGNYTHPACFKIFSNYGVRRRRGHIHSGVDLSYPLGTPVVAAFDGMIRVSTNNAGGYGQLIVIRHYNDLETYYAHLSKRLVNPGQMVKAGDTIALGGSTGRSRGSHLHFETRYMGIAFNPNRIIDFNDFKLIVDTLYANGKEVKTTHEIASRNNMINHNESIVSGEKVYYIVKKGDNLGIIARKYKTTVNKIKQLNNMKSDFLREGQTIRVL
jgi:murein DD-endopeptidase MepM/ murein hydrolase activator NlpD